jgi:transposase
VASSSKEAGGGFGRPAFFGEARSPGGGDRGHGKEAGPVHVANQFFGRLGMEEVLAQAGLNERALFSLDSTIYLYDLTSTYFEGRCERNEEARRGYSRDKRPECNQVLVALVVDREGFPIKHEVFERNRADSTTLWAMLEALERSQGRKEGVTVVVDRGMAHRRNLELIKSRGYHYVVAARQAERDRWLGEFEEEGFLGVSRGVSSTNA